MRNTWPRNSWRRIGRAFQHWPGRQTSRFLQPSVTTTDSNRLFSRQIETLVSPHDIFVATSTSGTGPNILAGVDAGRRQRAFIVGMTGETGGKLKGIVDLLLNVPSTNPQRIQEAHITIGHIVGALIEKVVCGR